MPSVLTLAAYVVGGGRREGGGKIIIDGGLLSFGPSKEGALMTAFTVFLFAAQLIRNKRVFFKKSM